MHWFHSNLTRLKECSTLLLARLQSSSGQTLAEYALLITVVAVGLVLLAMLTFRVELSAAFGSATDCLDGAC